MCLCVSINYLSSEFHWVQSSIEGQVAAGQQRLRKPKAMDEHPSSGKKVTATTLAALEAKRIKSSYLDEVVSGAKL